MSSSGDRALIPAALARELGGRLAVRELLGRGAMGTVFLAKDERLGRDVALKLLTSAGRAPERTARFEREGRIAAALQHPGIVKLHGSGIAGDVPYLVFELVEGARSLDQAFASASLRERVGLVREAAHALGYAHAQGVVHRDVKPSNLLVDRSGTLKVVDFGVAAVADAERLTKTGVIVGSPYWASPEQLQGKREVGPASDVWSLGVVLYEALTGQLPFQAETIAELILRVTASEPRRPTALAPDLPRELEAVCLRALAKDPAARYADCEAMAADLEAWLAGRPVVARPPGGGARPVLLGALAGVALAVVAAGLFLRQTVPVPPPLEAAAPPKPGPTPRAAPRIDPGADRALARLRTESDPVDQARLAREWLAASPDHPRAAEVQELARAAERRTPLVSFQHGDCEARGAWVDDHQALSWGLDGRLILWSMDGAPLETRSWVPWQGAPLVAASISGTRVLLGSKDDRLAWVALTAPEVHPLRGTEGELQCLSLWRSGQGEVWGAVGTKWRGVWLYRILEEGEGRIETLVATEAPIRLVGFARDGERVVVVSGDGRIHQGKVAVHERSGALENESTFLDSAGSLAVASDGNTYAVGTYLGRVLVGLTDGGPGLVQTDLSAGKDAPRMFPGTPALAHHNRVVTGLAFSADRRKLWSLAEGQNAAFPSELKTWDLTTGTPLECRTIKKPAHGLSISPDGTRLLVSLAGGELQVWRAQ